MYLQEFFLLICFTLAPPTGQRCKQLMLRAKSVFQDMKCSLHAAIVEDVLPWWDGYGKVFPQSVSCLIGYSELLYKWLTSQNSLMHFGKKEFFEVQSSRIGRKEIPIDLEHSCRCTLIGGVHLYVEAILFRTFFTLGLMSLF